VNDVMVMVAACIALTAACLKGVSWAFRWVYVPTLILVPGELVLQNNGLPDLTPQRAAALGLILGALLIGKFHRLLPRWQWFDLLALAPVLSFSISYATFTDFEGFYNRLPMLVLDWACPYLFVRSLITSVDSLRKLLTPLVLASVTFACLAVYECRMATRIAQQLWALIGVHVNVIPHYTCWRWGLLRANLTFAAGPLTMATFFVTVTPLMLLWGLLRPQYYWHSRFAALATAVGCFAGLSRGPMVALAASAVLYVVLGSRSRIPLVLLLAVLLLASPFLLEAAQDTVEYTQQRLRETGNTAEESGYYRVALLLIYGKELVNVGWWGDPSIPGSLYEQCWSTDNAYLWFFFFGGWIGAVPICVLVMWLLAAGLHRVFTTSDANRRIMAAIVTTYAGMSICMGNVWFAGDYGPFFWITCGLLANAIQWSDRRAVDGASAPRPNSSAWSTAPGG